MKHSIAIANQKGGVGKTTTAVNLSASLAALEVPTLLIDLDPQSNASLALGVDHRSGLPSIYDVIIGRRKLEDVVVGTCLEYLQLVPSHPDLVAAEVELVGLQERAGLLKQVLFSTSLQPSVVVIDCPPALGLLTLNAMVAASNILIPVQCEFLPLEGLARLLHTIELTRNGLNPDLKILGVLLTMFDRRNRLSHQVAEEVERYFLDLVFPVRIPRNVRLAESPSHGKPAILFDVQSLGAQSYLELAEIVLSRLQGNANTTTRSSSETENASIG